MTDDASPPAPRSARLLAVRPRSRPRRARRKLPSGFSWFAVAAALVAASAISKIGPAPAAVSRAHDGAASDGCDAPLPSPGEVFRGPVTRVIDGDSLCVGGVEVRLGDFDAPERGERGASEASAALRRIASGREVVCRTCEGARRAGRCISYDRIVATCRIDGRALGEAMRDLRVAGGGR